jgi:hypothetical protein
VSDPRYRGAHIRLRKALIIGLRNSADGVDCAHGCGVRIERDTPSSQIDLAHEPGSDAHRGLAHAHCNRSDGAQGERRPPRFPTSRAVGRDGVPATFDYTAMCRADELRYFGREGVADGERVIDEHGRTMVRGGLGVYHYWWLDVDRDRA